MTHTEISDIIKLLISSFPAVMTAAAACIAAVAACIAAWKGARAEYHGKVAASKIETLTDNVNGRMGELITAQKAASYREGSEAEKANHQNGGGGKE